MKKYRIVLASFVSMLCLGGVYGWSIIASELMRAYDFSAAQTQLIFGTLIAVFPITMIFVGRLAARIEPRRLVALSSIFFLLGYLLAGLARGNVALVWLGIGIFGGISTGFGYWVFLTIPVQWFPERKGLITGIAVAGFGFGAVVLSTIFEKVLPLLGGLSELFIFIGVTYGLIILAFSAWISRPLAAAPQTAPAESGAGQPLNFLASTIFYQLFFGLFAGTFAGLMIIGNLKIIGEQFPIENPVLVLGVTIFAVSNFLGRVGWGYLSDYLGASRSIFLALTLQGAAILLLGNTFLNAPLYLLFAALIGFGFGGNFVLFARETAQVFGVERLGTVYPYVFLGYALAGIIGPLVGGSLFDRYGNFAVASLLAALISLFGGSIFLLHALRFSREAAASKGN